MKEKLKLSLKPDAKVKIGGKPQANQTQSDFEQNQLYVTNVNPLQPPLIKILNPVTNIHDAHPINTLLKQINLFCQLTMVRASNFKVGSSVNPRELERYFDLAQIQKLAA